MTAYSFASSTFLPFCLPSRSIEVCPAKKLRQWRINKLRTGRKKPVERSVKTAAIVKIKMSLLGLLEKKLCLTMKHRSLQWASTSTVRLSEHVLAGGESGPASF